MYFIVKELSFLYHIMKILEMPTAMRIYIEHSNVVKIGPSVEVSNTVLDCPPWELMQNLTWTEIN